MRNVLSRVHYLLWVAVFGGPLAIFLSNVAFGRAQEGRGIGCLP
jgi:hypothetical protein